MGKTNDIPVWTAFSDDNQYAYASYLLCMKNIQYSASKNTILNAETITYRDSNVHAVQWDLDSMGSLFSFFTTFADYRVPTSMLQMVHACNQTISTSPPYFCTMEVP